MSVQGVTLPGPESIADRAPDFEPVMRRHQAMVFSVAYHFLGDKALAEEVAQDVFLSLYRNLRGMKSAEHIASWLRQVAVQRSIDEARKRKRKAQMSLESVAEPAAAQAGGDVLREQALWRLVAALPEIPRMAIILRYQEDLSPPEIAAAMGRSVATVKSDLQRALALLREKSARVFGGKL